MNNKSKKVAVLYSAMYGGGHPFDSFCEEIEIVNRPHELENPDSVLVIWGGSDINPKLYNHPQSRTTYPSASRDPVEWDLIGRAVKMGIPIIGVCRGAQMLCAKAGGFLIQDVENHVGQHRVVTHKGDEVTVNSIHHQMLGGIEQVPHELLAWCDTPISSKYIWKDDQEYIPPKGFKEPEMVWFPEIKGMAIQWHPEGMSANSEATKFIFEELQSHAVNS